MSLTTTERYFFLFLFFLSIVAMLWLLEPFYSDFIFSVVLVGIFYPLFERLQRWLGGRKRPASLLVCLLITLIVFGPATFLISSISTQAYNIYQASLSTFNIDSVQEYLFGDNVVARSMTKVAEQFNYEYTPERIEENIAAILKYIGKFLYDQINIIFSNVLKFLFHFTLTLLITFFLFVDGYRLKRFLFDLSPLPESEEEKIVAKFSEVSKAILLGNGISSTMQGILAGAAFSVAGIPSAVFWGTVMAILAFLPFVGITLVFVPATIILFLDERYFASIALFAFCATLSLVTENLIKPTLIGSKVKMHTLIVFLSILGGLSLFGILGIIYGPFIVTFFITFVELYQQRYGPPQAASVAASPEASATASNPAAASHPDDSSVTKA